MSSIDRLDVLRERNKDLLIQLKHQREKLQRLGGCCSPSRKREREAEDVWTLTGEDRGPARAALTTSTGRFDDACERETDTQATISTPPLTFKHRGGTAERTAEISSRRDGNRYTRVHDGLQDTRPLSTKSCLVNHGKEQREARSRVTFQSDECEEIPALERHHLQPLLGYDWIAGVLDVEDSLIERSDEFFSDLCAFRSLNKDECVHTQQAEFSEENHSDLLLLTDKDGPEANKDTHQCTFSYRINSRLFPVPLLSEECCPVCKKHKSSQLHTSADPALIRVSIPRSTLLPPYKYKAHRRCSFDPSDSLGLPSHCLSGWSNTGQSTLSPPSSLDLRSSLNMQSSTGPHNKDLEDLSLSRVSRNQHSSDQIPDVSRLARHNFQHSSTRRKLGSTSYPAC
ncbi:migration and invasion-inhibitory protein isoform X1 [Scomber scombrus]|uniref:Migration and invasion-inhibitory protein isoform X1 n=1 Tax=Scomber scombrus TaxID=13677 RepID=A0AAV1MZT9_SCOSC|nr:migration and invasion-inhibitory protein isoform X1 [Scomber scombrus]